MFCRLYEVNIDVAVEKRIWSTVAQLQSLAIRNEMQDTFVIVGYAIKRRDEVSE